MMNNREELIRERMAKIHETISRPDTKVFMVVPWNSNSNMIRWFSSLKDAVAAGKRFKEQDYRYEDYDINMLLYDGTSTILDSTTEIEKVLAFEKSFSSSYCLRCAYAASESTAITEEETKYHDINS